MWLQTLRDQSIHSGPCFIFVSFFFVAFYFFIFRGEKYDETGKKRGHLALRRGQNFSPAEQAENALLIYGINTIIKCGI